MLLLSPTPTPLPPSHGAAMATWMEQELVHGEGDLEGEPPVTWSEGAPAARGDITGVEDYVDAFRASHAAAQASWNGLVPQVALFMEAGAKAEALGIPCVLVTDDDRVVLTGGLA